ncbi:MAG: TIGR02996 domain-containing protein [Polyangiales bacterium]
MTLAEDLIAAIAASPDDDGPRLVFADALTAQGDPRGELIVVQCALARPRSETGLGRDAAIRMRRRERSLLDRSGAAWAALDGLVDGWWFRRGFVEHVSLELGAFLERHAEILVRAPLLRSVRLDCTRFEGVPPLERIFAACPQLEAIDLENAGWNEEVDGVFSDWTRRNPVDVELVTELVKRGLLGRLRGLALRRASLASIAALLDAASADRLETLELEGWLGETHDFDDASRAKLHTAATRLRPRSLVLSDSSNYSLESEIVPRGGDAFFERIERLYVARLIPIYYRDPKLPVAEQPFAPRLRVLSGAIQKNPEELERIVSSRSLDGLEELHLPSLEPRAGSLLRPRDRFDPGPLVDGDALPNLRVLELAHHVDLEIANRIVGSRICERLEVIDLRHNGLHDHGKWLRSRTDCIVEV